MINLKLSIGNLNSSSNFKTLLKELKHVNHFKISVIDLISKLMNKNYLKVQTRKHFASFAPKIIRNLREGKKIENSGMKIILKALTWKLFQNSNIKNIESSNKESFIEALQWKYFNILEIIWKLRHGKIIWEFRYSQIYSYASLLTQRSNLRAFSWK